MSADEVASGGDPCAIDANDPNAGYQAGVMGNETVIAQTFNKDLVEEYGEVMGNYSLWSNLTIWWGIGVNIHRCPYNARNHEYYSEDSVLSAFLGAKTIEGAQKYGVIAAPKHIAFNDSEVNRTGVATFMTEQKAREGELRAMQADRVRAYLFTTLKHALWLAYRKKEKGEETERRAVLRDSPDADETPMFEYSFQDLAAALPHLSDKDQALLRMKYFLRIPDSEIAEQLHVKTGSVRTLTRRARQRLIVLMKEGRT